MQLSIGLGLGRMRAVVDPFATSLLSNGKFEDGGTSWTVQSGWTFSGSKAIHTGAGTYLYQTVLTLGESYESVIKVDVADGSNFIQIYLGGSPEILTITSPGTYTVTGTAVAGPFGFGMRGIGDVEVDWARVQQV